MNEIVAQTVQFWLPFYIKVYDRKIFIQNIDRLIAKIEIPPEWLIAISMSSDKKDWEIHVQVEEKVAGLGDEFLLNQIIEAKKSNLLDTEQIAKAIEVLFLNDEYGVLESPHEDINSLYDRQFSITRPLGEADYLNSLDHILLA